MNPLNPVIMFLPVMTTGPEAVLVTSQAEYRLRQSLAFGFCAAVSARSGGLGAVEIFRFVVTVENRWRSLFCGDRELF